MGTIGSIIVGSPVVPSAGGGRRGWRGTPAWHPDDDFASWELYSLAHDDDFTLDGTTGDIEVWANRGLQSTGEAASNQTQHSPRLRVAVVKNKGK